MSLSSFFISRPIFSSVISITIVIAGLMAALGLPIAQYPEIAPPHSDHFGQLSWCLN